MNCLNIQGPALHHLAVTLTRTVANEFGDSLCAIYLAAPNVITIATQCR